MLNPLFPPCQGDRGGSLPDKGGLSSPGLVRGSNPCTIRGILRWTQAHKLKRVAIQCPSGSPTRREDLLDNLEFCQVRGPGSHAGGRLCIRLPDDFTITGFGLLPKGLYSLRYPNGNQRAMKKPSLNSGDSTGWQTGMGILKAHTGADRS